MELFLGLYLYFFWKKNYRAQEDKISDPIFYSYPPIFDIFLSKEVLKGIFILGDPREDLGDPRGILVDPMKDLGYPRKNFGD